MRYRSTSRLIVLVMVGAVALTAQVRFARADKCAKASVVFARQVKALEKVAGLASATSIACAFGTGPDDARFAVVRRAAVKTYRAFLRDVEALDRTGSCARRDTSSLMHDTSMLAGDRIGRAWAMCTTEAERLFVAQPDEAARMALGAERGREVVRAILLDAGFPDSALTNSP